MADRPVLFSAPMVLALMAGTKTQTRRIIKPQPDDLMEGQIPLQLRVAIGDRLYTREQWRVSAGKDDTAPRDLPARRMTVFCEAGGSISNNGDPLSWQPEEWPTLRDRPEWVGRRRQAMHMPRWASRITLLVKDVRVERLKDISRADALAEGIIQYGRFYGLPDTDWDDAELTAEGAYFRLWDRINGAGAADLNPFVVAYTFQVIKQNIDQIGRDA
jgi:hypothetical protein